MSKPFTPQTITANRLQDGLVVFIGPDNSWVEDIAAALVLTTPEELADAEAFAGADADRNLVVEPYAIEVTTEDGGIRPTKYREYLRTLGPTVRRDLGKQADLGG